MTIGLENNIGERYQQLFFQSPAVTIISNSDTGDIVAINQAAIDFYCYSDEEFRYMKIFDINTAQQSLILECLRDITMSGKKTFVCKHRLKNGQIRDVEVFSGVINVEGQKLISSIVVDVTAKLEIEKEREKNCERVAQVLAATRAGIWDYDLINNTNYIDKQWKAILGYEEHELSNGMDEWESRWHSDDIERVKQAVRQSQEGKNVHFEIEHRLLHKDGTYLWVNSAGKIVYNESHQPIRAVGAITDITKIKEVEARILESENKLKDFARAVPDVSAIVDEDGRYIEVFGKDKDPNKPDVEMQGMTFHELFPQDVADSMLEDVRQTILTGENRSMIRQLDFGSVKRYFEGRTAPMNYRANGKKTVVVVVSDITERLEVDRMLKFTYELQRKSDFRYQPCLLLALEILRTFLHKWNRSN